MRRAILPLLAFLLVPGCVSDALGPVPLSAAVQTGHGGELMGYLDFFNLTSATHVRHKFELVGEGKASGCLLPQRDVAAWTRGGWPAGEGCAWNETKARESAWLGKGAWVVAVRMESCVFPCTLQLGHDAPSNMTTTFAVTPRR